MPQIKYTKLDAQVPFHGSRKPKVYMSGGYGSGKSYALVMKGFQLMNINKGVPGGLLVPSYAEYKRDIIPLFEEICELNRIRHRENKNDKTWYFPQVRSKMYVFTAEKPQTIRGPTLGWGLINEVESCAYIAFLKFLGRMRAKKAKLIQIAMSGTPESFSWAYDYFEKKPRADTDLIYARTRDNIHNANTYVEMLKESYDPLMLKQYLDGVRVNLNQKAVAYAFDRKKHTSTGIEMNLAYPIWVSIDFNVTPMAATLWNSLPLNDLRSPYPGRRLVAFDEVCIESSNTYELAQAIMQKLHFPSQRGLENVVLYPDPAGAGRSTKSRGVTDMDILRQAGFKNIKYKSHIRVRDCINSLNAMLSRDEVMINLDKCPQMVSDLEQCVFKKGAFEIDKSNLDRTHWLDGLKNMVDYEFPINKGPSMRVGRYL